MDLVKAVNLGYCTVQWKWKVSMEPNKLRLQYMRSKASQPWPQVRCTNDGILWVSKKMPHPSYNDPRYLLKVWSIGLLHGAGTGDTFSEGEGQKYNPLHARSHLVQHMYSDRFTAYR